MGNMVYDQDEMESEREKWVRDNAENIEDDIIKLIQDGDKETIDFVKESLGYIHLYSFCQVFAIFENIDFAWEGDQVGDHLGFGD